MSPVSTLLTCTLHRAAVSAASPSGCTRASITNAAAGKINNAFLFVFTCGLRGLFCGFGVFIADSCSLIYQLVAKAFCVAFAEFKDCSMKSAIRVHVFDSQSVVLLVGEEADGSASAKRNSSLA